MADNRLTQDELRHLVTVPPLHRWLGLELVALDGDGLELAIPWRDEFLNDATDGVTHGGILATLIDASASYTMIARLGSGGATIDMRVDYLRPALPGRLTSHTRVVKMGRTFATIDVDVRGADQKIVATGRVLGLC